MTTYGAASNIPLAEPNIGQLEREYVLEAVDSGFVSSVGPFVAEFEREFAETVGARYAVACSSGTAAIHIALVALGVRPGTVVAVSDFTFVGSVNPVRYLGAEPLFIDSERATWNMDPELLGHELQRRAVRGQPLPEVVEVVHALGQPARIEELRSICDRFEIAVLEDAAESLGAGWRSGGSQRHTGTVGRVGAFSFNGNKIVTTGGGGMLVTDDQALAERAKHLTTQAKVPDTGYLHDEVGYNYRMTNLAAGLGLAQLSRLPAFVARKRQIAEAYDDALRKFGFTLPPRMEGYESTYWLYSVLVPEGQERARNELLSHLQSRGIGARTLWRPLHQQPPFSTAQVVGGHTSEELFHRGISLPCSTNLSDEEQAQVIVAVEEFFEARC